ncbi:MAG: hypothetical protein GX616_16195, partial [Planctomycetes bacterium]|nr:hypothetical protein [Planctomycetota bacterium]
MRAHILRSIVIVGVLVTAAEASERPLLRYTFDEETSWTSPAMDLGVPPAAPGTFGPSTYRLNNTPGSFTCASLDTRFTGAYVTTSTDVNKIDALTALTATLWIKLAGTPKVDDRLLSDRPATSPVPPANTGGWDLQIAAPPSGTLSAGNFSLSFAILHSTGTMVWREGSSSPSLDADNKWVFIAVTLDGSGRQQYYVGSETTPAVQIGPTTLYSLILEDNNSELRIAGTAAEPSTDRSPSGYIDDVRIYGSALAPAQLEEIRLENLRSPPVGAVPSFHGITHLANGCSSSAEAVSADGSTVVGLAESNYDSRAITWKNGVMTALPHPSGASDSYARCVSADGSVVAGNSYFSSSIRQAIRWVNGVAEPLGYLPGGQMDSYAEGISADGNTVVGSDSIGANYAIGPFKWVPNTMQQLPALGSQVEGIAWDVSPD